MKGKVEEVCTMEELKISGIHMLSDDGTFAIDSVYPVTSSNFGHFVSFPVSGMT
jgi:hypothetical protein